MILEKGNMWDVFGKTDLFLVTTNPIINKRGELVMGRGIAKQMRDMIPNSAKEYAEMVRIGFTLGRPYVHTLYYQPVFGHQTVGYFMVKDHWADPAKLSIIMHSTAALIDIAHRPERKSYRIDLNFPGIGNGKLKREEVLPIIEQLPDNVHIWELP